MVKIDMPRLGLCLGYVSPVPRYKRKVLSAHFILMWEKGRIHLKRTCSGKTTARRPAVWLGNDDFTVTNNMTGGSLPAMVWQRVMAYAHQNIDLKPIPGIENPFVDAEIAAKAEEAEKKAEAEEAAAEAERPPVLSAATSRALRDMADTFRKAPPIAAPAEPETLSAL